VPKKTRITLVKNKNDELVPTHISNGWRTCVDYRKLNLSTCEDHFPLPFIDQMLECLVGKSFYYFLDGYSGYNQMLLILRIKKRIYLHVYLVHMHTGECSLVFVMQPQLFKDA
jgi:hypothetical protein